jgi:hypothetical protein
MRNLRNRLGAVALGVALAGMNPGVAAQPAAPAPIPGAGDLAVTVTYTGKGEIKAGNEISVFLFNTPEINGQSEPIGMQTLEKNGGVLNFQNLPETVYIAVVYDEKGIYEQQGPPPPGTPVSIHAKEGVSTGVKTGKGAKVAISFDDTIRMPQPQP